MIPACTSRKLWSGLLLCKVSIPNKLLMPTLYKGAEAMCCCFVVMVLSWHQQQPAKLSCRYQVHALAVPVVRW